jgi:hypothetical protein
MIIASGWDYNEQVIDIYRRHKIKTTFFCDKGEALDDFELGVRGEHAKETKTQIEEKGNIVKGYSGKANPILQSMGFSYVIIGPRWYFSVEDVDPFRIPVHVDTSSAYFWDVYSGQRDYFIFSGHGDCNEEWITRMLGDGNEFIDMFGLSERLNVRRHCLLF